MFSICLFIMTFLIFSDGYSSFSNEFRKKNGASSKFFPFQLPHLKSVFWVSCVGVELYWERHCVLNNSGLNGMGHLYTIFFFNKYLPLFWSIVGSPWVQRADCMRWSVPLYGEEQSPKALLWEGQHPKLPVLVKGQLYLIDMVSQVYFTVTPWGQYFRSMFKICKEYRYHPSCDRMYQAKMIELIVWLFRVPSSPLLSLGQSVNRVNTLRMSVWVPPTSHY